MRGPKNNKTKEEETQYLVLIDYDEVICNTAPYAYESIKFAIQMACEAVQINFFALNINWENLFHITRGTTEKNFIKSFCFQYNIPLNRFDYFEERFYAARAIWFKNMKSFRENTYDTYFPDAENFIYICKKNKNIHLRLITGNPKIVMKERLADHLMKYFIDHKGKLLGSFGDEALTREELINKTIEDAIKNIKNFSVKKDDLGFAKNIVYIGDAKNDVFSALNSYIKTVWVPSRSIQEVKNILATDYVIFLKKLLKDRFNVVNRIDDELVLKMLSLNS